MGRGIWNFVAISKGFQGLLAMVMRLLTVWGGKDSLGDYTFVSMRNVAPDVSQSGHDAFPVRMTTCDFSIKMDQYFRKRVKVKPCYLGKDHIIVPCDRKTANIIKEDWGGTVTVSFSQSLKEAKGSANSSSGFNLQPYCTKRCTIN